jgi:hypothetical protein
MAERYFIQVKGIIEYNDRLSKFQLERTETYWTSRPGSIPMNGPRILS